MAIQVKNLDIASGKGSKEQHKCQVLVSWMDSKKEAFELCAQVIEAVRNGDSDVDNLYPIRDSLLEKKREHSERERYRAKALVAKSFQQP